MSGETIVVLGTTKTLEANGGAIANLTVVQADDANYDRSTDGADYPDAEFVLAAAYTAAPTENTVLALYARPLNIDGANSTLAPEATRPTRFIGSFVVDNTGGSTVQYMTLAARDVPKLAAYYIHNSGTGQQVNAGWTLKVTPRTYKAAP